MTRVGFIVEGKSEMIVYESENFQDLLVRLNLTCVGVITPESRTKFFNEEQIIKYFNNIIEKRPDKVVIIIDQESNNDCINDIKKRIIALNKDVQVNIIQVKTLESWFLADSNALSNAFKEKFQYENPENIEGHPFDVLQNLFLNKGEKRGLGSKESTLPAKKMVNKYNFSIENAANHPNCPSAKYFLQKLSELNPN